MSGDKPVWNDEALAKLERIPFFARRIAKKKIERRAAELGEDTITPELMERVRSEMKNRNRQDPSPPEDRHEP